MEQVPNWLAAVVAAAGMTAYADELYPKASAEPDDEMSPEAIPPLH